MYEDSSAHVGWSNYGAYCLIKLRDHMWCDWAQQVVQRTSFDLHLLCLSWGLVVGLACYLQVKISTSGD